MKQLQRIITIELEEVKPFDECNVSKEDAAEKVKRWLTENTDATHVNVVRVQDFIHEG